jgi:hypothetical protein
MYVDLCYQTYQSFQATTTQHDTVTSGEEFDFQAVDDDSEMSDTSGPPNPSAKLEAHFEADAADAPVTTNIAHDLIHFFDGVNRSRGKFSSKGEEPVYKTCKLCSYVQNF